jgi:hypothetical protein
MLKSINLIHATRYIYYSRHNSPHKPTNHLKQRNQLIYNILQIGHGKRKPSQFASRESYAPMVEGMCDVKDNAIYHKPKFDFNLGLKMLALQKNTTATLLLEGASIRLLKENKL